MLFVGAFHTMDCPNLDSLAWFVDTVLPLIEAELGWETRLTIAGYAAPGVDLIVSITIRGSHCAARWRIWSLCTTPVVSLSHRHGSPRERPIRCSRRRPAVCRSSRRKLLRGQLGWTAGQDILAAGPDDPAAFAAAVLALYRNEHQWQAVRDAALRRLEQENGKAGFTEAVAAVLALQ